MQTSLSRPIVAGALPRAGGPLPPPRKLAARPRRGIAMSTKAGLNQELRDPATKGAADHFKPDEL